MSRAPLTAPIGLLALMGLAALAVLMIDVSVIMQPTSTRARPLEVAGTLVEVVWAGWFLGMLALANRSEATKSPSVLTLVWAIIGLAGVIWVGTDVGLERRVPVEYWIAAATVVAIFAAAALQDLRFGWQGILGELASVVRRPTSWGALAAAAMVFLIAPSPADVPNRPPPQPRETAEFLKWFKARPRLPHPADDEKTVTVVTFIDYQCPGCKAAADLYGPVFDDLSKRHGARIKFLNHDFPLESECNADPSGVIPNIHRAACEAAAAVKIARRTGQESTMERWLWTNQTTLTEAAVLDALTRITGIKDGVAAFQAELQQLSEDTAAARALGVKGTPRYWVNGVMIRVTSPENLRNVIEYELSQLPR